MKLFIGTLFCLLLAFQAVSQTAQPGTWVPDDRVRSIARGGGKVFLTGDFRWIGEPYDGRAAVFNTDLSHDDTYEIIDFPVQQAIPDDAGGWYTVSQGVIGHIKSDKSAELLPIEITTGSAIYAIRKSGNILYIGGQFGAINGTTRANIAAVDLTNNTVTSWNPGTVGTVYSMEVAGSLVYIGGSFTSVGGMTRRKIAAIDAATGVTTSWNPVTTTSFGYILDIIVTPSAIYFGGSFTITSPSFRSNFAAVNTTTGAPLSFNPQPNDVVRDLLLDGTTLYITGEFTHLGAVPKYGLASFDTGTGTMTSFNTTFPDTYSGPLTSMAVLGSNLYVAGDFIQINGEEKAKLAVVNKTTGALVSTTTRNVSDPVYTLNIIGSKILVGFYYLLGIDGEYNTAQCAALDETTGKGFGWTPEFPVTPADSYISSSKLHYANDRLFYWQELFYDPDDSYSTVLGALNPSDGTDIATWNVTLGGGRVTAWAFSSDALYLAGTFTHVNGTSRAGFAAVDLITGSLLPLVIPYTPNYAATEEVRSMAVSNDVLYVAGRFNFTDGGVTRNKLAAWNATTGALQSWAPQLSLTAFEIPKIGVIHNERVYLVGGVLMRVNAITGLPDSWSPDLGPDGGSASSIAIQGNYVYLAGGFSPGVKRVGIVSGAPTAWQPNIHDVYDSEGAVYVVETSSTKLYVGGDFFFPVATGDHMYYAQFDIPADAPNDPPQIESSTTGFPVSGIVSVDLLPLISDPDDNLDISTLTLLTPVSEQGAPAAIDAASVLTLTYETPFSGTDRVTIEVCDEMEACTLQELAINIGGSGLLVFNAVSPNADGLNDLLTLMNIPAENKVTILNRWGVVVCTINNYNNQSQSFRGLNDNGNELPDGTYYYRIDLPDGQEVKTGYLSLRR